MHIKEICKKIRTIRIEKNLKLESVAVKASMSITGYGNIERCHVNSLSLNRVEAIAKALEVSMFELLVPHNCSSIPGEVYISLREKHERYVQETEKMLTYLRQQLDECAKR
ncbi:MAG: helix-turn-helix transcriptional regulator [Bacteroidota bacterium]